MVGGPGRVHHRTMALNAPPQAEAPPRQLRRATHGRMVGGVAAGLADYLEVDAVIVRVALVVLALVGGVGLPLYLAAWVLVPEEGSEASVADELMGRARAEVDHWRDAAPTASPGEGRGHGV